MCLEERKGTLSAAAASGARVLSCVVLDSEPIAPDIVISRLSCPDLARDIQPGQFFNLAVPGDERELLRIPMSYVETDPRTGIVLIAYRVIGEGTRRLAALPAGTRTDLIGPAGHGWKIPEGIKKALLVCGGSGIAPIMSLAALFSRERIDFHFVQGARTSREVIFDREVRAFGCKRVEITTDDGTQGTKGFPTHILGDMIASEGYDQAYVCGPTPLMAGVARLCAEAGLACQVSLETGMACGFGACATCVCDTIHGKKGVCADGPVFDAKEVVW